MKFTFIYPYKEINHRSLLNDTLTMLEYTSLRFANYLACLGFEILICSENSQGNGKSYVHDNIIYDSISNIKSMNSDTKSIDCLITIDTFDYLDLPAQKKYSWLSSSIENMSLRKNSANIINYDVEIITFKELGGDFEIPYAIMEIHSNFACESDGENSMNDEKPYGIITTNPQHGLEEILNNWDDSLMDLYIVSKTLDNKTVNHLKTSDDRENIKIISPKNSDHMVKLIKNARFYMLPQLPKTVFNSFAILSQYYGVPTLSYNYHYNYILHKNNMGGINVANMQEFMECVRLLANDNDMHKELSHQASILRHDLDMEKIFMELATYFHVDR